MRGWWTDLMDLVLPTECAGCGEPRAALCARCRAALYGGGPRRVRPVPEPPGLPVVHAAAPYGDEVRALLLAHKERGALGLATPLGHALARAIRADQVWESAGHWAEAQSEAAGEAAGAEADHRAGRDPRRSGQSGERSAAPAAPSAPWLLVPVPSARRAVRARGHDAVRRVARAAAAELRGSRAPARVLAALHQRRPVADQARLGPRQRRANLAGALEVAAGAGPLLRGAGRIVLVDDLMTTGASLAEAARALAAAGVRGALTAAVIAAPPGSFTTAGATGTGTTRSEFQEVTGLTHGKGGMPR